MMYRNSMKLMLLIALSFISAVSGTPIHYLKPPKLHIENLGERMLCHRPVRQEMPKIAIEKHGDKTIIHNYGHAGSGWTLAPGCVRYLLQQFSNQVGVQKDDPLIVIGAGIMGLLTSYMLLKSGYTKITIIAEQFDDLPSHKAGGFCAPTTMSGKSVDAATQYFISEIGFGAYTFYAEIARGQNEDFDAHGARFVPVYLKRDENRLKAYEDVVMAKPEDVIVDFSNGKRYEMKVYKDAIFMDTQRMMISLTSLLKDKVSWVQRRVRSFDEIEASYIFNCAGLGATTLTHDATMTSGQGHLILLQKQQPEDLNYMIGFSAGEKVTESGQLAKLSVYIFPKHVPGALDSSIGVLGGTYIEGADERTPNEQEFEFMVERAREFFGF